MFEYSMIHILIDELVSLEAKFNVPWKKKRSRKYMNLLNRLLLEIDSFTTDKNFKAGLIRAMIRDKKIPMLLSEEWNSVDRGYTQLIIGVGVSFEPYVNFVDEFLNVKDDAEAMAFRLQRM